MEGSSEINLTTTVTRSTETESVPSPTSRHERRAAALRLVADAVLSEQEEEEEEEDLCSEILSSFIKCLDDGQWESIRERMREPLTQAHLAQVSRRIIRVVSELVFQLLVPALMVRLQAKDFSEASASKSCKFSSQSEEETQNKDSRSSPVMLRPFVEDPLQKHFVRVSEDSLSSTDVSAEQAQEQVAEVTSAAMKSLTLADGALAEEASWQDVEQFLEPATEEVISVLIKNLDSCQEKKEAETKSAAEEILKNLVIKMRFSRWTKEKTEDRRLDESDLDSLDDFKLCCCYCCWYLHDKLQSYTSRVRSAFKKSQEDETPQEANPEVRDGSPLQGMVITYPMSVCSQQVIKDLSSRMFRRTSLKELREFLMKSLLMFSLQSFRVMATFREPHMASVDFVATEMLDTVVNSVNQLCQPQPRKFTSPWQWSENTTVAEDQVASTALAIKVNLQGTLRNFFSFHKEAFDKLKEGKKEKERRALSAILSSRSDKRAEDTQEDSVMHSIHSTATGSCESRVKDMAGVVRSFLDDTEQSLKEDGRSVQSGDAAVTRLEELISQDKLSTFSRMLADKLTSMLHQQELSLTESLDPSRKARSDSELSKPTRCRFDSITPTEQVYLFVEEAVKRLLTSLIFPPPSWGMGHMIQVQCDTSSAANWAESVEKYDGVIGVYSQLMSDQVMARVSMTSRLQQGVGEDTQDEGFSPDEVLDGVTEPKKKKNTIHFFQKLPNKIKRKLGTLNNKEV